jgi:ligand-binding sensor domain-containing protein
MKLNKILNLGILVIITLSFSGCNDKTPVAQTFKLPSRVINKIVIDKSGVKWFATGKGIVSFDGNLWTTYSGNAALNNNSISTLAQSDVSGKNEIWLGSKLGASTFNYTTNTIGSLISYTTKDKSLLSDTVSAIDIDQSNVKFIGTTKGLSILKGTHWASFVGRPTEEILSKYKISAVATTTNGWIYASTIGGGVSRFKYTDAVSGATTYNQPYASGLVSDTVYTVIAVNDGHQWYGTNKGASLHTSEFTKIQEDWVHYSRENGLICDSVYAIGKDLAGKIWFGTPKGVSMLKDSTWVNYTTRDGLVANKINTIAIDLDGSVWFGTDDGISHLINNQWINF